MKIILPFPSKRLSPNYHAHWRAKERERKAAFTDGFVAALTAMPGVNFESADAYQVDIAIRPPDRRRRDIDNIHASLKHYLDGICHALKVDDKQFRKVHLDILEPCKCGQVEVDIVPLPAAGGTIYVPELPEPPEVK